jgi:glycine hydroxymethyltransferase
MMVMDTVKSFGIDGKIAEETLDNIGIATNKQIIPDDPRPPLRPSGIRLGTPACTTRGMNEDDMVALAGWIVSALRALSDEKLIGDIAKQVNELCKRYPVPGIN